MFKVEEGAKCPYCDKALERKPARKKKCPHCGEYIYVRDGYLSTAEEAKKIDGINQFGFTDDQYKAEDIRLSKQFGQAASSSDVIWGLCNKRLLELMKTSDFGELSSMYFNMAIFLDGEGRDPFQMLKQARKMDLIVYKQQGFKKVEIFSGACSECKKLHGMIFSLDKAIQEMPVPNINCTLKSKGSKHPFCRCHYMILPDFNDI